MTQSRVHEVGHYRPQAILLDRGIVQPEAVAYGSAVHPERGGWGHVVPLFASARDVQTVKILTGLGNPTTTARQR